MHVYLLAWLPRRTHAGVYVSQDVYVEQACMQACVGILIGMYEKKAEWERAPLFFSLMEQPAGLRRPLQFWPEREALMLLNSPRVWVFGNQSL